MKEPEWLLRSAVELAHDSQIAKYGGSTGLRDEGLLESALARPRNLHAYGEEDLCALAAAYAFGIARNHPFVDGNKRTAFAAAALFLVLNGRPVAPDREATVEAMLALAAGQRDEAEFADWLRAQTLPTPAAKCGRFRPGRAVFPDRPVTTSAS